MKAFAYAATTVMMLLTLFATDSPAAESTLTEQEAPSLQQSSFTEIIKQGNCIVMYYNSAAAPTAAERDNPYGMTPLELGDRFMRRLIALRDAAAAQVKFYKVDWKNFAEASIVKIRSDVVSVMKRPENPSFALYTRSGDIPHQVRGLPRPDVQAWFISEFMNEFIPAIRSGEDEYLRIGWAFTDTNTKYISLTGMRQESMDLNGRTEKVRIVSSRSREYDGASCEYEQLYLPNGKLVGSIENYGKYGRVGYFDYDGTGKMQYRVRYRQ